MSQRPSTCSVSGPSPGLALGLALGLAPGLALLLPLGLLGGWLLGLLRVPADASRDTTTTPAQAGSPR